MTCGACKQPITDQPEGCWYCGGHLCVACWEERGHCGHAEAETINEASRREWREGQLRSLGFEPRVGGDVEIELMRRLD